MTDDTSPRATAVQMPWANDPELGPELGWKPSKMNGAYTTFGAKTSFVSGDATGQRFRIRYYDSTDSSRIYAKLVYGPAAEGPPRHGHGGSSAAVLDEVMGYACWRAGHPVVAAEITIRFKATVPLGVPVIGEGWVERVEGRRVYAGGHVRALDGTIYVESSGIFVVIRKDKFPEMIGVS